MKAMLTALLAGLIFGLGLVVSGMTQPSKVIGFLDILGDWDPALAFVMVGAIGVHLLTRPLVLRRERPVYRPVFGAQVTRGVDARLLGGATLFGVGWGLSGVCPGPAVVVAIPVGAGAYLFGAAMLVGMLGFHLTIGRNSTLADGCATGAGSELSRPQA